MDERLHSAVLGNKVDEVEAQLNAGASANACDSIGWPVLVTACSKGYISIAQFLLQKGANVNKANSYGVTALMSAAFYGYDSLIVMLLSSNADGNLKDENGWTALHYAAMNNHSKVVRILLENGCDMNIRDNSGQTALQFAVTLNRKDAADAIKTFTVSSPTASSALVVPNSSRTISTATPLNVHLSTPVTQTMRTTTPTQQLRNESSEKDRQIAEMRRQITDLPTSLRASACQVEDLQRELEQLRESNQAIQAEKSALQQQLADQEAVTRTVADENERQVGEVRRLLQLMQQRDEDNKQLQTAVDEQKHLAAQKQREANELQEEITRMASRLDDNERQLQQKEEELDGKRNTIEQQGSTIEEQRRQLNVLRQEVQEKQTTNERLARALQRSESAVQELQQLQHQYDSVTLIRDDSLHVTGLKLGEGAYGEVGVGMWSGVGVAVKTFHEEPVRVDELNISFIRREVSVSSRVHHPNVVSICGAIIENEVPLRIVMELLEGSLKDVMKAALRSRYLSTREQVDIAVGCLCGVMYLHQLQPALLHGDIRSTNILIGKTMEAKIGDLGSCRFSNESLSVGPLSPQYIAPERVVEGRAVTPRNTTQADVYSLGVTFVELFTGVGAEVKRQENPRDRISAAAALMQVNAVKQNDEYTSCPPKRMVKGKKRNEDKVTLVEMPWM
ncbi:uncharacterized protein LOC134182478 isoform X2 [Corticium candelabrum]|uniref:uncharacterized protein LOC134182478 isoform X2 n=1 Tax=Corticium candelabrum TaxID=121492 RepID=UPI002E25CBA9|nr:uncharacterized protein LOC134182478 isoform X2 [Corticium candelabrum]